MPTTYTAHQNQTIPDIADEVCGTVLAAPAIAYASGLDIDTVCDSGQLITIPDYAPRNESVRAALELVRQDLNLNALPIATGEKLPDTDPDPPHGLNYEPFPFPLH